MYYFPQLFFTFIKPIVKIIFAIFHRSSSFSEEVNVGMVYKVRYDGQDLEKNMSVSQEFSPVFGPHTLPRNKRFLLKKKL